MAYKPFDLFSIVYKKSDNSIIRSNDYDLNKAATLFILHLFDILSHQKLKFIHYFKNGYAFIYMIFRALLNFTQLFKLGHALVQQKTTGK
jgi:hypothetical protein